MYTAFSTLYRTLYLCGREALSGECENSNTGNWPATTPYTQYNTTKITPSVSATSPNHLLPHAIHCSDVSTEHPSTRTVGADPSCRHRPEAMCMGSQHTVKS